jgi:hypothetical protein
MWTSDARSLDFEFRGPHSTERKVCGPRNSKKVRPADTAERLVERFHDLREHGEPQIVVAWRIVERIAGNSGTTNEGTGFRVNPGFRVTTRRQGFVVFVTLTEYYDVAPVRYNLERNGSF